MTTEQKAAIRARSEDYIKSGVSYSGREFKFANDAFELLAALDQCEQERDKVWANHYELSRRLTAETTRCVDAEQQLTEARRLIEKWREAAARIAPVKGVPQMQRNHERYSALRECSDDLAKALDNPPHPVR